MMEIDISDEELLAPIPEQVFTITKGEALYFLKNAVKLYSQFNGFPKHHRSYKYLQRQAAIYQFILDKFENEIHR